MAFGRQLVELRRRSEVLAGELTALPRSPALGSRALAAARRVCFNGGLSCRLKRLGLEP